MADLQTLIDMGFTQQRASRALELTNNRGVEPAMEWLLAHGDEQMTDASIANVDATTATLVLKSDITNGDDGATALSSDRGKSSSETSAKSLKCTECNRLFKNQGEMEFHAAKTGHINFTESTEEKRPLTEDEKRDQLLKLEEKLKQKRLEREEREKMDALDRERVRIKSGKDMGEARRKLEEQEMKKIVDQRKREKQEEKVARDRVRAQIEADKLARKNRLAGSPPGDTAALTSPPAALSVTPLSSVSSSQLTAKVPIDYKETRIQVRLSTGQALTQTFNVKEPLSAVRLFVQLNQGHDIPFSLMTTFPRKVFVDEDFDKPLDVLGLVPSAVLIVTKSI